MASLNRVLISGGVCFEPQLDHVGEKKFPILKFNIVCVEDNGYKSYFNCVQFGSSAESTAENLEKDNQVLVEGRLKQEAWKDKTGNWKREVKIMVDNVQILPSEFKQQTCDSTEEAAEESTGEAPF